MSSMRSASSRTKISTWLKFTDFLLDVVQQAPGSGNQYLDAGGTIGSCCRMSTPP